MRRSVLVVFVLAGCGAPPEASPGNGEPAGCAEDCASREYAQWPMPNPDVLPWPTPARLSREGGVVADGRTGLVWAAGLAGPLTHADAGTHCEALEVDGEGGFRLPTRIELVSLLDRTRRPTLDGRVFDETPADYFWSATDLLDDPGLAYSVYFGLGETATGVKAQASAFVRCVRGGHRIAEPRLSEEGDLVRDRGTGLLWERTPAPVAMVLSAAVLYCEGRSEGDGEPLRLPTDKELQTLVDPARARPALDPVFEVSGADAYWARSPPGADPLAVHAATGLALVEPADEAFGVRCVGGPDLPP